MNKDPLMGPRISAGTFGPWVMTVTMMINMLINAKVLAFASLRLSAKASSNSQVDVPLQYLYIMITETIYQG